MNRQRLDKRLLFGAVPVAGLLTILFCFDALGVLFLWLPWFFAPPPIPPPVFTDSCDPGGTAARLALADTATRIAVPWSAVTRASLTDSHSQWLNAGCSGTQVEIDYVSKDLHSTFVQLCDRVRALGWADDAAANNSLLSAPPGIAIEETCNFRKHIGGRQALLVVDRFAYDGYTGPSVVLFLNGPDDPSAHP
jgi:hypothetical protein